MLAAHGAGFGAAVLLLGRGGFSPREGVLVACGGIYLGRYAFTSFHLLQRGVGWKEAAQVGPFLFALQAVLGYLGSRSATPWGWSDWFALALCGIGSFLNTASEWQRRRWKQEADHRGHLYTGGLFRWAMHINYFGDSLLFTGFALLTTSPWALLIPLAMILLFVFVHIPTLDAYLARRYPAEFAAWARRSRRFVPFLY
jgi:steroid 5-alpha reductase family enzyme